MYARHHREVPISSYLSQAQRYTQLAPFVFWVSIWSHLAIAIGCAVVGEWPLVGYFLGVTALYAVLSRLSDLPSLLWATLAAYVEVCTVVTLLVWLYDGGIAAVSLLLFLVAALFFVPVSQTLQWLGFAALNLLGAVLLLASGQLEGAWLTTLVRSSALAVSSSFLAGLSAYYQHVVASAEAELQRAHQATERLLHNTLPVPIAERLKQQHGVLADHFDQATVLFADIVGFTPLASSTSPDTLLRLLDDLFTRFDRSAERCGMEKIKTIGDAYMAAGGVPQPCDDHADRAFALARAMLDDLDQFNAEQQLDPPLALRVGLHTGPLVAGVIGEKRFAYDLWGDTVNTAARMESHGMPGAVQLSEPTRLALSEPGGLEDRGEIAVKGKGMLRTWLFTPAEA